ncbi:MAG: efflux RND transporter permease subunit, partial [Bacteroidota bacterium]
MNIPKFSIDNFQFTITAFTFMLAMGLSAYFSMPRSEDPVMDIPAVNVVAIYPGAAPKDIESQVVDPIEEVLNELEDVKEIVTDIRDGVSVTQIEFFFGVDPEDKFDEVQAQVNGIKDELPSDIYKLDFFKQSTSTVAIFQMSLVSNTASYARMKKEGERLKKVIEKVTGVREVEIEAYPEQEIRIALNPVKMTEMNISLDQIEGAIQSNNANIPGGSIKLSNKSFNIKTSGAYSSIDQIQNTVVGVYQGKLVYLKHLAAVYFDYEDEKYLARFNGERSLVLTVQQKKGYNIFDVADPIKDRLGKTQLAEDMRLEYVFDQSLDVADRIDGFSNNLLQGIALVGVIIFLALGFRSSTTVMLAIPFSILIGLWVVNYFGLGLQQMSIAGLVVALGLLVDNSIAIIENIERFLALGYSKKEAAIKGTQQLVAPMLSATLTTVLAFVPVIMMPETTGEFIKALPITVIACLAASLIIAVTLTPFVASKLLKAKDSQSGKPTAKRETFTFRWLTRFVEGPYRRVMRSAFRYRWLTIGFAVACFVGALMLFPYVGVSFFPKAEKPQFRITINLPNGSNLDATDKVVNYVESVLAKQGQIKYYASNIGHGNPRIYYNINPQSYASNHAEVLVILNEYKVNAFYALLDDLREEFNAYPNARIDVREFVQGPPSEAPIAIKIYGDDLNKLKDYAEQIERIAEVDPTTFNIDNPLSTESTDLYFNINKDKAMMLGVPTHVVDKTIRSFVNGSTIARFRDEDAEEYNIVMRYDFEDRFKAEDFEKLTVSTQTNRFVPLKHLANLEFSEAPTMIAHLNTDRIATILADVKDGYTLDDAVAALTSQMDQLDWEEGYYYEFKGDLEKREESFGGLGMASIMALILILGVLIIQFKSFSQPLIIFSALPLATIGSILMLYLMGV